MTRDTDKTPDKAQREFVEALAAQGFEGVDAPEVSLFEYGLLYRPETGDLILADQSDYDGDMYPEEFHYFSTKVGIDDLLDAVEERPDSFFSAVGASPTRWTREQYIAAIKEGRLLASIIYDIQHWNDYFNPTGIFDQTAEDIFKQFAVAPPVVSREQRLAKACQYVLEGLKAHFPDLVDENPEECAQADWARVLADALKE